MATKKQIIVIKKVYVNKGGHHGGSWKVALADFMTAMMAFFLVMWLLGQSEETKKAISDYFSSPSMVEYNYENYGAELTLEKLFLDFVNEPLKAVQSFFEPADKTPNILDMGSSKVVAAFMADKMTDVAKNVSASKEGLEFDIPDTLLFERGSSKPHPKFIEIMEKLTAITSGLKESDVKVTSALFTQVVPGQSQSLAEKVAQARLDLVKNKIAATFEHPTNKIGGSINVKDKKGEVNVDKLVGFIHISIQAKDPREENKKGSETAESGAAKINTANEPVFETFVEEAIADTNRDNQVKKKLKDQISDRVKKIRSAEGVDPNLSNPVELEINRLNQESEPISK